MPDIQTIAIGGLIGIGVGLAVRYMGRRRAGDRRPTGAIEPEAPTAGGVRRTGLHVSFHADLHRIRLERGPVGVTVTVDGRNLQALETIGDAAAWEEIRAALERLEEGQLDQAERSAIVRLLRGSNPIEP